VWIAKGERKYWTQGDLVVVANGIASHPISVQIGCEQ
jgi:hypothetical protein